MMIDEDLLDDEILYPKRRKISEIRIWDEDKILFKIEIPSVMLNKTHVKKLISNAVSKLWNGERLLKISIEVIYKGQNWE